MNRLQNKIKQLEEAIAAERLVEQQCYALVKAQLSSPQFISYVCAGSFISGFVLVKDPTRKLIFSLMEMPSVFWRIYVNMKLISELMLH